jgi:hypothetical protein
MQQLTLFNTRQSSEEFTPDDYETPDYIAKAICDLVLPTDICILEPFAGTGQIAQHLPKKTINVYCNEIKKVRVDAANKIDNHIWYRGDYFSPRSNISKDILLHEITFDLIVSNPPFSLCLEAIAHSLTLLNSSNPTSRILFLMPLDWNCSKSRAQRWDELDAHIHHVYRIPERIDYLMNGKPCSRTQKAKDGVPVFKPSGKPEMMSGRQCYDAVFDIRLGKKSGATSYLGEK